MSHNGGYRPVVLLMLVGAVVLGACQSDFASMDLSLDESRFGWKAQVEPDEPFGIDLYGNGAYPEAEWRLVEVDSEHVQLLEAETIPARPEGAWIADYEGQIEGAFLPVHMIRFEAGSLGESLLGLEVQSDELTVDRYEVTVAVVEDACTGDFGGETLIIVANRCGG